MTAPSGRDGRTYIRLTVDFFDSPKIAPLSPSAKVALLRMIAYSRQMLTDGFLPDAVMKRFGTERQWGSLLDNDPERPSLSRVDGGYLLHDYEEHQQTRAEIQARRSAGAAGGRAKAAARQGAVALPGLDEPHTVEAPAPRSARATRVPDPFPVTPDLVREGRRIAPLVDLEAEHEAFMDYWRGAPGSRGTKLDWTGTWRNWMRRAQKDAERAAGRPGRASGGADRVTNEDRNLEAYHARYPMGGGQSELA